MTLKKLTLPELLKNSCSKFSKNLSLNFVASGKRTYQDLYNEVVSIANHLLHLGVKKGDKVAILSANMPNWGITQFAIANIGAIAVPILPGFCSTELQNILEHAEVKVIFVSRLLAKCLEGVKTPFLEHKILINNFATMPEGCYQPEDLDKLVPDINLNNTTPLPEVSIEEEDIASIIYTSGTTGFSKGVVLTQDVYKRQKYILARSEKATGDNRTMAQWSQVVSRIVPTNAGSAPKNSSRNRIHSAPGDIHQMP